MSVHKHPTGGFRAYKKILGVEHQFYSKSEELANKEQEKFEVKAALYTSLKFNNVFSPCGRLMGLRVITINKGQKVIKPVFLLQVSVNGKQVKTQETIKNKFESHWRTFIKLWKEHYDLDTKDFIEIKKEIIAAKRL